MAIFGCISFHFVSDKQQEASWQGCCKILISSRRATLLPDKASPAPCCTNAGVALVMRHDIPRRMTISMGLLSSRLLGICVVNQAAKPLQQSH